MESREEWHTKQIEDYHREFPYYQTYAETMARVFKEACQRYAPEAIVEARAKSLSSFAEKAIRKKLDLDDPVRQFTDLCGARVITHTQAEVDLICKFIKENFKIDEANSPDIRARLQAAEFGYLSMHFVVQLKSDVVLGVQIPGDIGERKAEVQVRTLLQHAYAGVTHDRLYKSEFPVPEHLRRDLARVAAILEEADGTLAQAAGRLDEYKLNYGAFLKQKERKEEIKALETILEFEPIESNKPRLALRLVRILKQTWEWGEIKKKLDPFVSRECLERAEIWLEHGFALCNLHRGRPESVEYKQGQAEMEWAALHGQSRVKVQALSCLAWSHRNIRGQEKETRKLYQQAHQADPFNPYVLASHLEYEIFCRKSRDFVQNLRQMLLNAIDTCRSHADARIEVPWAYFCMGKFRLLLGQVYESLGAYAKAIHLCTDENFCVPAEILEDEIEFLNCVNSGEDFPPEHEWVHQLLLLGKFLQASKGHPLGMVESLRTGKRSFKPPVIIVVGGTDRAVQKEMEEYRDLLLQAFEGYKGTIISGGTTAGIPGLVGSVAGKIGPKKVREFKLIGYVPKLTPAHVSRDDTNYDEIHVTEGVDFTAGEPLQNWNDLIAAGVDPSEVRVLGINGGRIAAFEYRLALALGASVGVIESSGRAASDLLPDADWWDAKKLLWLPRDPMTIRSFVTPGKSNLEEGQVEKAGMAIHENYLMGNRHKNPDPTMLPWDCLEDKWKNSDLQQAIYAEEILGRFHYGIREAKGDKNTIKEFGDGKEMEAMAEMEHGRWNVERLRDGWKYGPQRIPEKKISPYLVPWGALSEKVKDWDREAVKNWPNVFAKADLEIYRLPGHAKKRKETK